MLASGIARGRWGRTLAARARGRYGYAVRQRCSLSTGPRFVSGISPSSLPPPRSAWRCLRRAQRAHMTAVGGARHMSWQAGNSSREDREGAPTRHDRSHSDKNDAPSRTQRGHKSRSRGKPRAGEGHRRRPHNSHRQNRNKDNRKGAGWKKNRGARSGDQRSPRAKGRRSGDGGKQKAQGRRSGDRAASGEQLSQFDDGADQPYDTSWLDDDPETTYSDSSSVSDMQERFRNEFDSFRTQQNPVRALSIYRNMQEVGIPLDHVCLRRCVHLFTQARLYTDVVRVAREVVFDNAQCPNQLRARVSGDSYLLNLLGEAALVAGDRELFEEVVQDLSRLEDHSWVRFGMRCKKHISTRADVRDLHRMLELLWPHFRPVAGVISLLLQHLALHAQFSTLFNRLASFMGASTAATKFFWEPFDSLAISLIAAGHHPLARQLMLEDMGCMAIREYDFADADGRGSVAAGVYLLDCYNRGRPDQAQRWFMQLCRRYTMRRVGKAVATCMVRGQLREGYLWGAYSFLYHRARFSTVPLLRRCSQDTQRACVRRAEQWLVAGEHPSAERADEHAPDNVMEHEHQWDADTVPTLPDWSDPRLHPWAQLEEQDGGPAQDWDSLLPPDLPADQSQRFVDQQVRAVFSCVGEEVPLWSQALGGDLDFAVRPLPPFGYRWGAADVGQGEQPADASEHPAHPLDYSADDCQVGAVDLTRLSPTARHQASFYLRLSLRVLGLQEQAALKDHLQKHQARPLIYAYHTTLRGQLALNDRQEAASLLQRTSVGDAVPTGLSFALVARCLLRAAQRADNVSSDGTGGAEDRLRVSRMVSQLLALCYGARDIDAKAVRAGLVQAAVQALTGEAPAAGEVSAEAWDSRDQGGWGSDEPWSPGHDPGAVRLPSYPRAPGEWGYEQLCSMYSSGSSGDQGSADQTGEETTVAEDGSSSQAHAGPSARLHLTPELFPFGQSDESRNDTPSGAFSRHDWLQNSIYLDVEDVEMQAVPWLLFEDRALPAHGAVPRSSLRQPTHQANSARDKEADDELVYPSLDDFVNWQVGVWPRVPPRPDLPMQSADELENESETPHTLEEMQQRLWQWSHVPYPYTPRFAQSMLALMLVLKQEGMFELANHVQNFVEHVCPELRERTLPYIWQ